MFVTRVEDGGGSFTGLANMNSDLRGDHTVEAMLYLFSPKEITDVARRPYLYRFQPEFVDEVNDLVSKAQNGLGYDLGSNFIRGSDAARTAILPTMVGQRVTLSRFSNSYTFVLIVTRVTGGNILAASLVSKQIFSGYIEDTPYALSGAPNMQARFRVTHKTILNSSTTYDNQGPQTYHSVENDIDYIPIQESEALTESTDTNPLADMRPDRIIGSAPEPVYDQYGFVSAEDQPMAPPILQDNLRPSSMTDTITVSTLANDPTEHLAAITGSLVESVATAHANKQAGFDGLAPSTIARDGAYRSNFKCALSSISVNNTPFIDDIEVGRIFTFGELISTYPNLKDSRFIVGFDTPYQLGFDVADSVANTDRNVISSILADTLPPACINCKFAKVVLHYRSWETPMETRRRGFSGMLHIEEAIPLFSMNETEYGEAFNQLFVKLHRDIFPIILAQDRGHFAVNADIDAGRACRIDVTLMDFNASTQDKGIVNITSSMGGYYSPMIGSFDDGLNNQYELSRLREDVAHRQNLY